MLRPYEATVLALLPHAPARLVVELGRTVVKPGGEVPYQLRFEFPSRSRKAGRAGLGVRFETAGPDGASLPYYTRNHVFAGGKFDSALPVALNAPRGRYTITATSTATGHRTAARFDVVDQTDGKP